MAAYSTLDYDKNYGSKFVYDDYILCFYNEIQNKHGQVRYTQCKYTDIT